MRAIQGSSVPGTKASKRSGGGRGLGGLLRDLDGPEDVVHDFEVEVEEVRDVVQVQLLFSDQYPGWMVGCSVV